MNARTLVVLGIIGLWATPLIAEVTDQALEVPQPDAAVVAETVSPGSAEPADSVAPVDGDATQPDGDVEASGSDALFAPPALQSVAPSRPAALQQSDAETAAATTAAPESDPEVNVSAEAEQAVQDAPVEVTAFDERLALGYADAQHVMGRRFEQGDGVPTDLMKAGDYYFKAASQGYAEAQSDLGRFYAAGIGIRQDISLAFDWFLQAAEQGLAEAQFNTALILQRGSLGEAKPAAAADWYWKAASQGHDGAIVQGHGSADQQVSP